MAVSEWRSGWKGLLAAVIAQSVASLYVYSIGMFFEPLQRSFGWSRTVISSGMTVASVIAVIGSPFMGILIDRIGPRRIALVGIVLYPCAFASFALFNGWLPLYYALWVLFALSALTVKTTVWVTEVIRCFVKSRGLAISLVVSGSSLGGIVIPTLTRFYIDGLGWRGAYVALALTGLLLAGPLVWFFFGTGRTESNADAQPHPPEQKQTQKPIANGSLREQMLSRPFLQLIIAVTLCSVFLVGVSVHLVPMLTERGIARVQAAQIAGAMGASALAGRIITGLLIDRLPARAIGVAVLSLGVAGALVMLTAQTLPLTWLAAILIGFALGAEVDVIAYLLACIYGRGHFGALFGVNVGALALCAGVGPLGAALVFDLNGSYNAWFIGMAAGLAMAALLIATVSPRPFETRSP